MLKRCVLNMLIGVLNGEPNKFMLYKVSFIETANSENVVQFINNGLQTLA
jgi:hypothetical protein